MKVTTKKHFSLVWILAFMAPFSAMMMGTPVAARAQSPDFTSNELECITSSGGHFGPDAIIFGTVDRGDTVTFTLHVINSGDVDVPDDNAPAVQFTIFSYNGHLQNVQIISLPDGASVNAAYTDSIVVSNITCTSNDTARIVWSGIVSDPGPDPEGYAQWIATDMSPEDYVAWPGWYARQEPAGYFRLDGEPGTIGDLVFNDLNGNGALNGGEPGLDNVDIHLYEDSNGNSAFDPASDTFVASTTSGGGGLYYFCDVVPGTYFVDVVEASLLPGMSLTFGTEPAGPIVLDFGEDYLDADFGYVQDNEMYDYGDVPDPMFPSYYANNGPRHLIGDMWLGGWINGEVDSKQTDIDEWDDGVVFLGSSANHGGPYEMPYVAGEWGAVQITVRGTPRQAAFVDGWIDWTMDGDWDDSGEHCVDLAVPVPNVIIIEFYVPDETPAGDTWARFRLYPDDLDSYLGEASNGEVEDYFLLDGQVAVELSSFLAQAHDDRVKLHWKTASENENMGFYVSRSQREDGVYLKLNTELIAGAGSTEEEHAYSFVDADIEPGQVYYYKLIDVDYSGNVGVHGPIKVEVPTSPVRYELEQNYPNPFNPQTTIGFRLADERRVRVQIYNLTGQLVKTLLDETLSARRHEVVWDGTDEFGMQVPSGVYLYILEAGDNRISKRMILAK